MKATSVLIAEDEPLLADALQKELESLWPELSFLETAKHGFAMVQQALEHAPDVLFADIRMPGQGGLEAAAELAHCWSTQAPPGCPFPELVFVTAYDQYAVAAFEVQAVDYLLKPVRPDRLWRTVQRVQQRLAAKRLAPPADKDQIEQMLAHLRGVLMHGLPAQRPSSECPKDRELPLLRVIQAGVGKQIHMVAVDDVLVFEAVDGYVRVLGADFEVLIRTSLKDLLPQLNGEIFWQIHRSTLVRASAIERVGRDEMGKLHLHMRGRRERWPVSRLYAQRFRAM